MPQLVTAVWVGGDERDIHFNSTAVGQGSATALPVWALYMRRVYADKSLGYDPGRDFDKPASAPNTSHGSGYGHRSGGESESDGSDESGDNMMEEEGSEPSPKSSSENYFE